MCSLHDNSFHNDSFHDDSFEPQKISCSSIDLEQIGHHLLEVKDNHGITKLKKSSKVSLEQLRTRHPQGRIFACDFPIDNIEAIAELKEFGLVVRDDDVINIDHHANLSAMHKFISSGNLAIDYVVRFGAAGKNEHVVGHHSDCDSVISLSTMRGLIPADPLFGEAVIAADHTGEPNQIADLLQAIEPVDSIEYSLEKLGLFLSGQPLTKGAQKLLDNRRQGRDESAEAIESGRAVVSSGKLSVVRMSGNMRNEFLPALLPTAWVILTFEPGKTDGTSIARYRLGAAAPEQFNLAKLGINQIDPHYGGRWNAGSNSRGGGTSLPLDEYVKKLENLIEAAMLR